MSKLKTKFDSASLKSKFSDLLESIDRNNTSKMIVERYYGKLASLEIAEGTSTSKDAYAELIGKGVEQNKARHIATVSSLSEAKTVVADSYLIGRIQLLESAVKELKAYSWMPKIKSFITEGESFVKENQTYILIESVIHDLELDRNAKYYSKAIQSLREASKQDSPEFAVVDLLESELWIPLVKRLYEYCNSIKGSVTKENPNFKVSKVYSPVEPINEDTFMFYSSGKYLEIKGNTIYESSAKGNNDFNSLVNLSENVKFGENQMRLYPNTNSVLDISFGDSTKVSLNGKVVDSTIVEQHLLASGFVKMSEQPKLAMIQRAINEGSKIKELDFAYKVTSSIFEGLSAVVFNVNDRIFIQKINKGMKENSIVEAASATEAVEMVKTFMNYDITDSLSSLVENERAETSRKNAELSKVENRIKFIIEKLSEIEKAEKTLGSSEFINEAKSILESELKTQNSQLAKLKGAIVEGAETPFKPNPTETSEIATSAISSKEDLVAGKVYTINGKGGYIYNGEADGNFMFQPNETPGQPLHMKESELMTAIEAGQICI